MPSHVLYRRWRPQRFADVVAQTPVIQTLSQAITTKRVSHAYLFCGPRGTGKTSTARVLAKTINCTQRPEDVGDACGACPNCKATDDGTFVDLIEIDAASNRGIDEMRSLRDKVHHMPGLAPFKVYIIDEAHMLTPDACNAFLKTLEEPPPHAIFILATTEPQKLPATIISRCQRFDFRRIPVSEVIARLEKIASAENVKTSPEAFREIARAAGGSLRDATNLLEQLITSYGSDITVDAIRELFGLAGEEHALSLVTHLLANETSLALALINNIASDGMDLRPLHHMVVECLRMLLLIKTGAKNSADSSLEIAANLASLSSQVSVDQIMRALRLFGQIDMRHDQPSPLPLELAVVEYSLQSGALLPSSAQFSQASTVKAQSNPENPPLVEPNKELPYSSVSDSPTKSNAQTPDSLNSPTASLLDQVRSSLVDQSSEETASSDAMAEVHPPANLDSSDLLAKAWPTILRSMSGYKGKRFDIGALLRSSKTHHIDGSNLVIRFTHQSNVERLQDELSDPKCTLTLETLLQQQLGGDYSIRVESELGASPNLKQQNQGHLVRTAINMGGHVVSEIAPSKEENE